MAGDELRVAKSEEGIIENYTADVSLSSSNLLVLKETRLVPAV